MSKETFRYTNEDIAVVWKPRQCTHSRRCWTNLLAVFNPREKPWVNMAGATTAQIVEQVGQCPSGALSIEWLKAAPQPPAVVVAEKQNINVSANGPLLVAGGCTVTLPDGTEQAHQGPVALCRCGASGNKPYCDGSHRKIGFEG